MKKAYAARQIKQSPGKFHADTKKRIEAIEELLQIQENDRLCSEIYNDGYDAGASNALKGHGASFLFAVISGIACGIMIAVIFVNSRPYSARSSRGY